MSGAPVRPLNAIDDAETIAEEVEDEEKVENQGEEECLGRDGLRDDPQEDEGEKQREGDEQDGGRNAKKSASVNKPTRDEVEQHERTHRRWRHQFWNLTNRD